MEGSRWSSDLLRLMGTCTRQSPLHASSLLTTLNLCGEVEMFVHIRASVCVLYDLSKQSLTFIVEQVAVWKGCVGTEINCIP